PQKFKTYYEAKHILFLLKIVSTAFPVPHTHHYLIRTASSAASSDITNTNLKLVLYTGKQKDFDYDCYSEMVYAKMVHFGQFADMMQDAKANNPEWREDQSEFFRGGRKEPEDSLVR
ncbi:hypothetical protein B0O99DRAFT_529333, partial [Bisporella sp. PMI_857]